MNTPPERDLLDDKVNRILPGRVVRKDLVRKVKVGANVPVFVLEYLLRDRAGPGPRQRRG